MDTLTNFMDSQSPREPWLRTNVIDGEKEGGRKRESRPTKWELLTHLYFILNFLNKMIVQKDFGEKV